MNLPEVVIAGGGPAGCSAACTLAKRSVRVTVYERGKPGKDKSCGDALMPPALEPLARMGIRQDRLEELGGLRRDRIDLYNNQVPVQHIGDRDNPVWVIRRAVIDQEIRDVTAEYATIQYETAVTDLEVEADGRLRLSLRHNSGSSDMVECDAVILASGAMNHLSRKFEIDGNPLRAFAVSTYAEMQPPEALIFQFVDSCKPGYRWVFPVSEKTVNMGIWLATERPEADIESLGEELLRDYGATRIGKWRGGWEPLWSGRGHNWHHASGIVSCGDAAGLVNPFDGEGITAALRSGEQAGQAVAGYLSGKRDPGKLEEYSRWTSEYFGHRYQLSPMMQVWNALCGIP